jgi:hypothetical protein
VKEIRLRPNVSAEIRAIDQPTALKILRTIDAYARSGEGPVKALNGKFQWTGKRGGLVRPAFPAFPHGAIRRRLRYSWNQCKWSLSRIPLD